MVESGIFLEVGLVIGIAALLALISKAIKQPTIIAYLIAGIVSGPLFFGLISSTELISIFAHVGVTFLLFVVGLSLDFSVLKNLGKVAGIAGITQFVITSGAAYLISLQFGFSHTQSFFIAAALAISSTIVAMNLLTEKNESETLHGKIIFGILIIQDLLAAIVLLTLPIITGEPTISLISQELGKGIALITGIFLISHFVMPVILKITAKSQEVLFLFSIGWALLIASLFQLLGFSIEIGALVAGMSLASSRFSLEIASKIKSLREFFIVIHLVFFGSLLRGPIDSTVIYPALIFSLLVLIGNPLIIMTTMKLLGFKKRTNFLTGIGIAQISELSLILIFLGFSSAILTQLALNIIILTALITLTVSSYMIYHSKQLYSIFSPLLNWFDGKGGKIEDVILSKKYDLILIGYNRMGFNILRALKKKKQTCLIIEYNPRTIHKLRKLGHHCLYGDANDSEFLNDVGLWRSKKIISTIPELETSQNILSHINKKETLFIATSHSMKDTQQLYSRGASFVIMPHFLGGAYMEDIIRKDKLTKSDLKQEVQDQRKELRERMMEGQSHPTKDKH